VHGNCRNPLHPRPLICPPRTQLSTDLLLLRALESQRHRSGDDEVRSHPGAIAWANSQRNGNRTATRSSGKQTPPRPPPPPNPKNISFLFPLFLFLFSSILFLFFVFSSPSFFYFLLKIKRKGPGAVRRGPVLSGYLILVQIS
jgi:hypothetical protein